MLSLLQREEAGRRRPTLPRHHYTAVEVVRTRSKLVPTFLLNIPA
jgi:hypothetical protein